METLRITNGAPSAAPPQPERVKTLASRKKRSLRKNIVFYALLSLVGVFMILPTVVMVLSSFKTYDEYYSLQFRFLPKIWAFDNYARVFQADANFFRWIGNTFVLILSNRIRKL